MPNHYVSSLHLIDSIPESVCSSPSILELPMENLKQLLSRVSFVIDELVIFKTVKKWKEYHGLDVDKITDVLDCVRLSEIPLEDMVSTVYPSNFFC